VPTVTIRDFEAREDLLPSLCLKCGDPATVRVARNFSWHPRWVYVLLLLNILITAIVAFVLTKRMSAQIPMCEKHRYLWRNFMLANVATLFAMVAAGIVLTMFGDRIENIRGWRGYSGWVIFWGWILALVIWLIVVAVLTSMSIYPTSITDDRMTLTGVSDRFVDALESERDEARKEKAERKRRRRASDDSDDFDDIDDAPPPLRPPGLHDDRIRE
jgi:magnesium-transporting ATPase (P-type)